MPSGPPDDISGLPSPPLALARVIEAASDPQVTIPQLGRIVASDPSITVQLLRLANSSVYRRGMAIRSVERAVSVLGSRALRNLALCVAVRSCVSRREMGDFDLPRFWEDSLRRAVASQLLAMRYREAQCDPTEAFTAGLLQDLGVLALIRRRPEHAAWWMEFVAADPEDRRAAEQEVFGTTHDAVAVELARAWALPAELAAPMIHHHEPEKAAAEVAPRCVIAAHAELLQAVLGSEDKRVQLDRVRERLRVEAGLESTEVDSLLGELGEQVTAVAAELGFRVGKQPSLESILQAANTGLVELNLSYEQLVQELEKTISERDALTRKLEQRNRELQQLSLTDELTDLPNRRALSGRMSYDVKRAARGEPMSFAVCDIDDFKRVNDTWGHDFGDVVLQAVAAALGEAVRETDMVARMGGEEFGVVFPGLSLAQCGPVLERVLNRIRTVRHACPDGQARSFTVSIGVSGLEGPYDLESSSERVAGRLYRAADGLLYAAKQAGKDRAVIADAPIPWEAPADAA